MALSTMQHRMQRKYKSWHFHLQYGLLQLLKQQEHLTALHGGQRKREMHYSVKSMIRDTTKQVIRNIGLSLN